MFTWNDRNDPPTDLQIAFDITDMLFSGADADKVERQIMKQLKAKRYETVDWLINECHDKIAELRCENADKQAINKLVNMIAGLERYKEDVKQGYVSNGILPQFRHRDDPWIAVLIVAIVWSWTLLWILH